MDETKEKVTIKFLEGDGRLNPEQSENFLKYIEDKRHLLSCIFVTCMQCGYTRRHEMRFHFCALRRVIKKIFSRKAH